MSLLDGLNKEQLEAVENTEGALLILAGAGSGKTKVITHRIAYIIAQKLAKPSEILAVTFTNKAAGEMKERINLLLNSANLTGTPVTWCSTFHSACVRILRIDGGKIGLEPNFSIYDSSDSLDVVKEAMDELLIDKKKLNPNAVRATISSAKNELITPSDYMKFASGYFQEQVAEIYPIYDRILKSNQAIDFDDIIMTSVKLFRSDEATKFKYRNIFKYIHVDEYQDTNNAQYALIQEIVGRNICVVGDDDQSIYGFRGANINNILNFEKDFPDAKIIKLEQNYRSTQHILDASHSIVSHNSSRREKKLWTENGIGEKIKIHQAIDENDEAFWVADRSLELLASGVDPFEIAVLYRTNAQSRSIEEAFLATKIPYKIVGGIRFYDRKEIKDLLAYMRTISNPADDLSLSRIINVPRRGIGDKTVQTIKQTAKSLNKNITVFLISEANNISNSQVKNFALILSDLNNQAMKLPLTEFIHYILDRSGYAKSLEDGTIESQNRIENLKELISVATKYDTLPQDVALKQFLEDVALIEDQSQKNEEKNNAITLMSIHASKGLEFKCVFIVGMEEMIFPHSRSYSDPKELEEERRLAYVAITRAKERLFITHAKSRIYFGSMQANPVSRFIEDIPNDLIEHSSDIDEIENTNKFLEHYFEEEYEKPQIKVKSGDKVRHEIFGLGTIIEIDESTVKINFGPSKGIKELAIEYARLTKV